LNVSQPFVITEIGAGRLKGHKVGSQYRIDIEDLLAYERCMRESQAAALERMADDANEMGLEY
jgi:excisionase family DNA binding protein